jgi:hypothetical protein
MMTAFVTPKSKKARNRFCNLMGQESECMIEQNKGDRVFYDHSTVKTSSGLIFSTILIGALNYDF